MKSVSVAVLKENLSTYLHKVEAGEEFIITSHRRPVARLGCNYDTPKLQTPTKPTSILYKIKGVRMTPGKSVTDMLVEDRRQR